MNVVCGIIVNVFVTETSPECSPIISPLCSFMFFTFIGTFFWVSYSVPAQPVLCMIIISVLTRDGELQKLSIHTVWPCFSRGSTRIRAVAVSAVIKGECSYVSFPVYARKDHKCLVVASHSS
jgi:hypothetical protein